MARPGPERKVSDDRLLLELFLADSDSVFAKEIQDNVPLETIQGVRDRLNMLVDESEYVTVRKVSGRNLYTLTDEGREYVLSEVRGSVD